MNLGMAGQTVERISFDYSVSMATSEGFEIRIETAFSIEDPSGHTCSGDPSRSGKHLSALLAVLHDTLTESKADDTTGLLVLKFASGRQVAVDPHRTYEAWTVAGPNGEKSVALPGGGLAFWQPVR